MSVRQIKKGEGISQLGTVSQTRKRNRQVLEVSVYSETVHGVRVPQVRITSEGLVTFWTLMPNVAVEVIKGLIENLAYINVIADEDLLKMFKSALDMNKRESAALKNVLRVSAPETEPT